jgi:hypothetical protein
MTAFLRREGQLEYSKRERLLPRGNRECPGDEDCVVDLGDIKDGEKRKSKFCFSHADHRKKKAL